MSSPSQFDVIVVGVGAMGAATCHELARRGARVLGLEQFGLAHALGSSHGHTRMIRLAYYEHPDYVPLLRRAYDLWDDLASQSNEKLLFRTGGVYMGPPDGHVVPGALAAAKLHGLAHEVLSHADLRKRHPQFALPDDFTGVHEPEAGFLLCEKSVAVMARLALQAGATIRAHEPVRDVTLGTTGVTVTTDTATYHADKVVFCGGPWSGRLLADLRVPLVVTRQTLGWLWPRNPAGLKLGEFPVWGIEQSDASLAYGFPMLDDFPGLKLARHGRGTPADPDAVPRDPTPADLAEFRSIADQYLPAAAGADVVSARICLYTNSPDGHFILDRLPQSDRAFVACGFSGHGFKFAPVIGEALADLALTARPTLPTEFLSLRRFA